MQFRFGNALLHLAQLLQRHRHQLFGLRLPGPGVDAEQAAIHKGGGERVDGVHQPALLPDLLEQPRRHAAAQQGAEQEGAVVVGVVERDGGEAEHDVHLIQVPRFPELPAAILAG